MESREEAVSMVTQLKKNPYFDNRAMQYTANFTFNGSKMTSFS